MRFIFEREKQQKTTLKKKDIIEVIKTHDTKGSFKKDYKKRDVFLDNSTAFFPEVFFFFFLKKGQIL